MYHNLKHTKPVLKLLNMWDCDLFTRVGLVILMLKTLFSFSQSIIGASM